MEGCGAMDRRELKGSTWGVPVESGTWYLYKVLGHQSQFLKIIVPNNCLCVQDRSNK